MSEDKVTFRLCTILTIGPEICASAAAGDLCAGGPIHHYARLIAPLPSGESHVHELFESIVESVVKGEIHVHAAKLTVEEIFKGAHDFRSWLIEKVRLKLNQFGLFVYNANVSPPIQEPLHEHLSNLGQKTPQDMCST
ncbi:hypothetical protein QYE76_021111 [Lolium multiflorum]|uniref:Flotillin-like n=1 Tax=Lolium multiflorum TaxID=4521 RepID=A0AAD8R8Z3_LOLMU|nr:hypothetical protein QYE76_021111 [Lolium multiflorum]